MKSREMQRDEYEQKMLETFPTIHSYFNYTMFDEKSGYYATGRVDFTKDYATFASDDNKVKGLAAAYAYQFFLDYQNLKKIKILPEDGKFNIVELGAGNGNLCSEILALCRTMAKTDPYWSEFNSAVHYYIVEKSKSLRERQKLLLSSDQTQVTIMEGDATDLSTFPLHIKVAVVFSNEVLDMFPVHIVTNHNDEILVKQVLPFVPLNVLKKIKDKQWQMKLIQESIALKKMIRDNNNNAEFDNWMSLLDGTEQIILLSEESFKQLHTLLSQDESINEFCFFENAFVPAIKHPELRTFLERNPEFASSIFPGNSRIVEVELRNYLSGAHRILLEQGKIYATEYMEDHFKMPSMLQTFSNNTTSTNIYDNPGQKDLTHYSNASLCEAEGAKLGLSLAFYGKQEAMRIDSFPNSALSLLHQSFFIDTSTKSQFKVLVQVKRSAELEETKESKIIYKNEKRFHGKSLPIRYAEFSSSKSYALNSQGKLNLSITPDEQKTFDIGFNHLEKIKSVFETHLKLGKPATIDDKRFSVAQLKESIESCEAELLILTRIKNKELISKTEKLKILGMNYFTRINFILNYPTKDNETILQPKKLASVSSKNIFTESSSHLSNTAIESKLNAITEHLVENAKWKYYQSTPTRPTSSARLVSDKQVEIHTAVAALNESYAIDPPLKPKIMRDPKTNEQRFVIELDEPAMTKMLEPRAQKRSLSTMKTT